jgi:hypothetical protein
MKTRFGARAVAALGGGLALGLGLLFAGASPAAAHDSGYSYSRHVHSRTCGCPEYRTGYNNRYDRYDRYDRYSRGYDPYYSRYDRYNRYDPYSRYSDRYDYRSRGRGYRDADRDGVRNRYDHDVDGDGIRNRRDRDIDGDGVPNYYDRDDRNPRRR